MWGVSSGWGRRGGAMPEGRIDPPDDLPDYSPDEDPESEVVQRFDGYHVRGGRVQLRLTEVEVDPGTRKVLQYLGKTWVPADTNCTLFHEYCAAHPRKGPKLLAAAKAKGVP